MRRILLMLLMTITVMTAWAVPANQTPQQYTQPDGTQVTLRHVGDEYYSFYLTDDNQMVLRDGQGFYFAEVDSQGNLAPSKVLAADAARRNSTQSAFVSLHDRNLIFDRAQAIAKDRRAARAVKGKTSPFRAPAQAAGNNWSGKGIGTFPNNSFPVTGSPKMCVILVQFSDVKFSLPNPSTYFTNFANGTNFTDPGCNPANLTLQYTDGTITNFTPTGSARQFFTDCSNGAFTPQFDVYGPVTLSNTEAYYGAHSGRNNDVRAHLMIRDAVAALDSTVDFSQYDLDNDGEIDMVYVIFAGLGEANGGSDDTIWPHAWYVYSGGNSKNYYDNKLLDHYACSAELFWQSDSYYAADGIGTFCHEFTHVLGLADEYDINYGTAYENDLTPGEYSLMDGGSYNQQGRTPPTYSIFQRNALGWADVEVLQPGVKRNLEIAHILNSNKGYAIETKNVSGGSTNEFYLLENRQLSKWDKALPGHGMLIWHITYNASVWDENSPNADATLQRINLVSANGNPTAVGGRPFPGTSYVRSYNPLTNGGVDLGVSLTSITENSNLISMLVNDFVEKPVAKINGVEFAGASYSHEGPVTLTLSTTETGSTIKYMYMTDDIYEGTYTSAMTISESMEFEFWAERDGMQSETTHIDFTITGGGGEGPDQPQEPEIQTVPESALDANGVATIDFSRSQWGLPENYVNSTATYFDSPYGIICNPGTDGSGWKKQGSALLIGKKDASITLPPFAFDVEKIEFVAVSGSSGKVTYNIYVGNDAMSTKDVTATNEAHTFQIPANYQAAETRYVLKITNSNNAQFQKIKIYKKGAVVPVVETVATPTFTPAGGEVEKNSTVSIACATEGAAIHYTTDGTDPTANSTLYEAPITIDRDVTIKAIAVKEGWNDSEVAEAAYTIKQTTVDPQDPETGDYSFRIVYKGNGNDSNDSSTAFANNSKYQEAVDEGGNIATMQSCSYVYQGKENTGIKFSSKNNNGTLTLNIASNYQKKIDKIVINATGYESGAKIAINDGTAQEVSTDAANYTFNLDGSTLTTLKLDATKRLYIKSIEFYEVTGDVPPVVIETVATPTFSPAAGEVESGTEVEIACATDGATIHYTLNGDTPTAESATYSSAISITEDVTIKAIAVKQGWNDSEVATAAYTVKATEPVDPEDPEEPGTEDRYATYTFDFTGDTAYDMDLLSGTASTFNASPYTCKGENVDMVLTGNTRWWAATGGNELRFYSGSSFTLKADENYKILRAELKGNANNIWDKTSFNGFAGEVTFTPTISKGNTAISGVDVQVVAVPSFNLSDFSVYSDEHGVKLICKIIHSNSHHVKSYKVWVVKPADASAVGAQRAEAVELGSIVIPASEITEGVVDVRVPLTLEPGSGVHTVAIRAHAQLAGDNLVYHSAWQEGDAEGSTDHENYSLDTVLTGIDMIGVDSNVIYYDLQGNRVSNPAHGQMLIRVLNGRAEMILVR